MSSDMVILFSNMPASSKVPPCPDGLGGATSLAAAWPVSFVSSMMIVVDERIYEMSGGFDVKGVLKSSTGMLHLLVAVVATCHQRCVLAAS